MSEESKIIVLPGRLITAKKLAGRDNYRAQLNMSSEDRRLVYAFAALYLEQMCPEWWASHRDKRADLVYEDNVGFMGELSMCGKGQEMRSMLHAAFPIYDQDEAEAAANRDAMERCANLLMQDGVKLGVKKKK